MSFWGSWSWLYFIGLGILAIGIIGYNIFKYKSDFGDFIIFSINAIGTITSVVCLLIFLNNLYDYYEQKKLYESGYSCIVNFNEENKDLMKTNGVDVLKKAVETNEEYFEIVDGEMRIKEYNFRYIKDDSWRDLSPINTNELSGEKCINKQ